MGPSDGRWLEGLRRAHYPPERNLVPAHLTLFRHLPPSLEPELLEQLAAAVRTAPPPAFMTGAVLLGEAVAMAVDSPVLLDIRARLADRFAGLLTPQDQAVPRLHVTIQNKVTPQIARASFAQLREVAGPRPLRIAGLACWRYAGGPWSPVSRHAFRG